MLRQLNIEGKDKVQIAIDRLQLFNPKDGYYLAFSGGKDSICIKALADMANVKYDAHYNLTTVDPPELVYFIREKYLDVITEFPKLSMYSLIERKKYPPTRLMRYCCSELKEGGGLGRTVITGVRWAESVRRKKKRDESEYNASSRSKKQLEYKEIFRNSDNDEKRRMMEVCPTKHKFIVNPIIDWTDSDVWEFIHEYNIPYCSLYDEGFKRLGCIGCPQASQKTRIAEFERYPIYKLNYMKAFDRMLKNHETEPRSWKTAQDVFDWWLQY